MREGWSWSPFGAARASPRSPCTRHSGLDSDPATAGRGRGRGPRGRPRSSRGGARRRAGRRRAGRGRGRPADPGPGRAAGSRPLWHDPAVTIEILASARCIATSAAPRRWSSAAPRPTWWSAPATSPPSMRGSRRRSRPWRRSRCPPYSSPATTGPRRAARGDRGHRRRRPCFTARATGDSRACALFGLGTDVPVTPWDWSSTFTEQDADGELAGCPEGAVLVVHSAPVWARRPLGRRRPPRRARRPRHDRGSGRGSRSTAASARAAGHRVRSWARPDRQPGPVRRLVRAQPIGEGATSAPAPRAGHPPISVTPSPLGTIPARALAGNGDRPQDGCGELR